VAAHLRVAVATGANNALAQAVQALGAREVCACHNWCSCHCCCRGSRDCALRACSGARIQMAANLLIAVATGANNAFAQAVQALGASEICACHNWCSCHCGCNWGWRSGDCALRACSGARVQVTANLLIAVATGANNALAQAVQALGASEISACDNWRSCHCGCNWGWRSGDCALRTNSCARILGRRLLDWRLRDNWLCDAWCARINRWPLSCRCTQH